jgi:Homeodomain-like domain
MALPPLRVRLDAAEQAELERRYQATHDAETRTRYQMVLLAAQGQTAAQVAPVVRRSPDTVRRVLGRYLAGGPDAVPHRPHLGQHPTTRLRGRPSWSGWPTWTPPGWRGQCAVDLSAAGRLPGRGHWLPCRDRDGPDRVAPGRVGVQAAPLGASAQGPGPAGVGKKRLRVEALLAAAAASAVPPPAVDLVPDATLAEDLFPEDLPRLLGLLGLLERADLYLHGEVEVALHRP